MPGIEFLVDALTPFNLLVALAGVAAGTVIGALPGFTATMAVAVLVPFTFGMNPASALISLGAIYTGAIYGGAYSAILLNTPGTPSAIATTFDGYPMAKRGDGDLAITLACLASVCGGLVGAAFLLILAPPLAEVALAFGPIEYFWLAIFGLTLISALSEGNLLKGLVGGCFGLMLSMVGVAEVGGDIRYTMDTQFLLGGVEVISALIGLYCIPVLIDLVAAPDPHLKLENQVSGYRLYEALAIAWRSKFNLVRSSLIGDGDRCPAGRRWLDRVASGVFGGSAHVETPDEFRQGRTGRNSCHRKLEQRDGRRRVHSDARPRYSWHAA